MLSQWSVYAVALNNGSPSVLNSQTLSNGEVWGFAIAGHFAYAGIQDGNPKSGFDYPVLKRMSINADGSLSAPQTIATLKDANIPYDLISDQSGKFLAATTGFNSGDVSVWSVNSNTGDLSAVPGSPFSTDGAIIKLIRFDPSSKNVYAINNPDYEPLHEDIRVFSVGSNGSLTAVQTVDLGDELRATDFKVDSDFVFIGNSLGGTQSNITVLRRDATSGQLSVANKTAVPDIVGGVATVRP
jgi:6-phosphogluconolactonase (cycloisomerase 2 family)